jgi:hypothetical protein
MQAYFISVCFEWGLAGLVYSKYFDQFGFLKIQ